MISFAIDMIGCCRSMRIPPRICSMIQSSSTNDTLIFSRVLNHQPVRADVHFRQAEISRYEPKRGPFSLKKLDP